jgi:pimeloyl-ACP methyl ester carboxylesterase
VSKRAELTPKSLMSHGRKVSYYLGDSQGASEFCLFTNGLYSNTTDWIKQRRFFQKRYNMIFLDYANIDVGRRIDTTKFLFDVISDDIDAIMKQEGIKRLIIIAHSMGGPISLNFAVRYPERVKKLVLINSGVEVGLHLQIVHTSMINAIENDSASESYVYPFTMVWWYSVGYLERITKNEGGHVIFDNRRAPMTTDQIDVLLKLINCSFDIPRVIPSLDSIECPVLLVSANNDFVFPPEIQINYLKVLRDFRFSLFDGFTHNIHIENYEKVNNLIMSFILEK